MTECATAESLGKVHMKSAHQFYGIGCNNFKHKPGPIALDKTFEEMKALLDLCFEKAKKILKEKKSELDKVWVSICPTASRES